MHPQRGRLLSYLSAFGKLLYTPACLGCGNALLRNESILCIACQIGMPVNPFFNGPTNEVAEVFAGRLPLASAHALLYFSKSGIAQGLLHALKYQDRQDVGEYLGARLGTELQKTGLKPDVILPVPLHPDKQKTRGYNQCHSIARGIQQITGGSISYKAVSRTTANPSQTKLNRAKRWDNVKGIFKLEEPSLLAGKTVLLIDDTLTTGATLESCGHTVLEAGDVTLSIATLAFAK